MYQTQPCPNCGRVSRADQPIIFCGHCGTRLVSNAQSTIPKDMSLQINLGTIRSVIGQLTFTFVVGSDGNGQLQIMAIDPTNLRKAGVFLTLGAAEFEQLKRITAETENVIARLQAANQMNRMLTPY